METLDTLLTQLVDYLQRLYGAPAIVLVFFSCIVMGYCLRAFKRFPNDGIPVAVILWGGIVFSLIAPKTDIPLRVWIGRNVLIGLIAGYVAWLIHNRLIKKAEERLGLFASPPQKIDPTLPPQS